VERISPQAGALMSGSTFRTGDCFATKQSPTATAPHAAPPPTYRTSTSSRGTRHRPSASARPRSGVGRPVRAAGCDRRQQSRAKAQLRHRHRGVQGSAKAKPWQSQGATRGEPHARPARSQGTPKPACRPPQRQRRTGGGRGAHARPSAPRGIPARAIRPRDCRSAIVTDPRAPMHREHDHQRALSGFSIGAYFMVR
jgi:hypothetical protein